MLTIENLNVDYYRRGQVIGAVRNFSLTLDPGGTVGLVGESGSGKSTVALAILRLIRAQEGKITSGRILFEGEDLLRVSDERIREVRGRSISMIFQDPFTSLNPVMRVREQMEEVFSAHAGVAPKPDPAILGDSLERVQLDPQRILSSYPHQLSGGQRQRVMIAIALLTHPSFLLADEPTTALDVLVQKDILDLLSRLQKELKMGMLLVSHNLMLVAQYAQRLAVMKEGSIVEEGDPRTLFKHPTHPYTRELIRALPTLSQPSSPGTPC